MEWKETKALIDTFSYALRVMHYGCGQSLATNALKRLMKRAN